MEFNKLLYVGRRVFVVKEKSFYITNIQDIHEENAVMLAVPISRGIPVYIADGTGIEVGFWETDGIYSYEGVVTQSVWSNSLRMYLVETQSGISRLQRRENYRLPVSCKVDIYLLDEDCDQPTEKLSTSSLNISLGGVCVKLPRLLEKGTQLVCVVRLEENVLLRALGYVVHHMQTNAADGTYALGIEFTQCTPADLRKLAQFLRAQEIRRRRLP